jgi:hypothetical protein
VVGPGAGRPATDGWAIGGGGGMATWACFFPPHPLTVITASASRMQLQVGRITAVET